MDDRDRLDVALRVAASIAANLLVSGEYEALASITGGRLLDASQMEAAVRTYGGTLVEAPADTWQVLDAVQAPDLQVATFHVEVPLWTEEEGRSDLTLELQLTEGVPGTVSTLLIDIHVH